MTFSLTLSCADLLLMLPEIILTLWLCGVLIVDFTFPKLPKEQLAYLSVCGLVIVLANLLWYDRTGVSGTLFHHMFVVDRMAAIFQGVCRWRHNLGDPSVDRLCRALSIFPRRILFPGR